MFSEKPLPTASVKRRSLDTINVENDAELDALTAQVLAAGNKIAESDRAEMIRKGIIEEHGNLLKTELPDVMCKDADRDFGG
jgi:translation initiation factor 6 (eIF-6)